jgi:hypothetical protein
MHFAVSTFGALKSFCDNAPTGQALTAGHGWFCGHLFSFTVTAMHSPFKNSKPITAAIMVT